MSLAFPKYRGRLAPSPTGLLHLGHARTFWQAYERVHHHEGKLILRNEDLDRSRWRPEFVAAMIEDLHWLGIEWNEGPDCGGPFAPYNQSERMPMYRAALAKLQELQLIYPCNCSRKDIQHAVSAPNVGDEEPVYPGTCRSQSAAELDKFAWRFRVPEGEAVVFIDGKLGPQRFVAGRDFGDFIVWRQDDLPAYQLACVVDDAAMRISEVVRGADLLVSTARQLLLYRVLGLTSPAFYHCELVYDEQGRRLAKRHDSLSLRAFRELGKTPEFIQSQVR
jgi:glutamyl-tRNA synthetase